MKKVNRRRFITSSAMAGMASLITSNSFANINVPAGTIETSTELIWGLISILTKTASLKYFR